jgi:superfamily I DNA/RNA helicase
MLVSLPKGRVGQPRAASAGGRPISSGRPGDAGTGPSSSEGPDQCQQSGDGRGSDHPSLYRHNREERGPASPLDLLADLTPSQQQAITATSPTVCVLASAGAGKTSVLVRRIGYRAMRGAADPGHVVAITFTRKAAGELRERLNQMGLAGPVTAGTFHSLAVSQLRRWWADRRVPEPALLERKGRLIGELAAGRPGLQDVAVADLASQLEWAKARLVEPAAYAAAANEAHRELPADAEAIAGLYARYEDEKRRRRVVDFDDLLARYTGALEADSRFAAAQRWRWRHVYVDELQDVNPLQYRMLMALLGDNDDLFVVGDPNQAIYGWNGSDPAFLANFPERWPAAEVVRLDDNHRSSPQVVAAASSVLGRQATPARSSRPDGPLPRLRCYPSEEAEAAGVAAQVLAARARGLRWDQMAVLVRANSQTTAIAQALRRAGVPLQAVGSGDGSQLQEDEPDVASGRESVIVSTFHRAKGLQWTAVWVCGLETGFVPIAYASTPTALAEERRLLYVALSRAERELYCSWARKRRSSNGAMLWREPSPWLGALAARCDLPGGAGDDHPSDVGARPDTPGRTDGTWGRRSEADGPDEATLYFLASARRRLARRGARPGSEGSAQADASTVALTQRLTEWRRRLARASGVPAHVLLHDSTVTAIAVRKPASEAELLGVPGVGAIKVARFGPAILEVVQEGNA